LLNIVLFEPEIPQNTGNIMRTCVGIDAVLHLIKPLGFSLQDKYLRRSGLDYLDKLKYIVYDDYNDFKAKNSGDFFFLTRYGKKCYSDINYKNYSENIYLVFGKESTGIDKKILGENIDNCYRIPTSSNVRSLNLSNCVAICAFEYLRQFDFFDLSKFEPDSKKGKDFLDQFKD
jgi:tRNA (cytidine/uridine-2'-O-)-methyltransferase